MTVVKPTGTPLILGTESWSGIFRTATGVAFTSPRTTELRKSYEEGCPFPTTAMGPHRGRTPLRTTIPYPRTKAIRIRLGNLTKRFPHLIPYPKVDFQYTEREGLLWKRTVIAYKLTELLPLMAPQVTNQTTAGLNIVRQSPNPPR